jgi:hypothetical protein
MHGRRTMCGQSAGEQRRPRHVPTRLTTAGSTRSTTTNAVGIRRRAGRGADGCCAVIVSDECGVVRAAATEEVAAVSPFGSQTAGRPAGVAGHLVRAAHRHRLAASAARARVRFGRDVLAAPRRVATGRVWTCCTRSGSNRCGPPVRSSGRARSSTQARYKRKRGSETGPSPVDRGRPGSKEHLLVDATGIPLAFAVTGSNRNDVPADPAA